MTTSPSIKPPTNRRKEYKHVTGRDTLLLFLGFAALSYIANVLILASTVSFTAKLMGVLICCLACLRILDAATDWIEESREKKAKLLKESKDEKDSDANS